MNKKTTSTLLAGKGKVWHAIYSPSSVSSSTFSVQVQWFSI